MKLKVEFAIDNCKAVSNVIKCLDLSQMSLFPCAKPNIY